MDKSDKIFVAGYRGLVGSALVRGLEHGGFHNLPKRDRSQLDLADERAVQNFFAQEKPAIVIFAAAKVGGIKANNDYPVEFLLDNLRIQNNVIYAAHKAGVLVAAPSEVTVGENRAEGTVRRFSGRNSTAESDSCFHSPPRFTFRRARA